MRKLLAIAAVFVLGCGSAPSQEKETATNSGSGDINLPANGEEYTNPCDVPSYQKIVVDGKVVVVEVPTLCNRGGDPYHGDPCPDCGDPSPEAQRSDPDPGYVQVKPAAIRERGSERQGSAR